jgi:hypothetical protein
VINGYYCLSNDFKVNYYYYDVITTHLMFGDVQLINDYSHFIANYSLLIITHHYVTLLIFHSHCFNIHVSCSIVHDVIDYTTDVISHVLLILHDDYYSNHSILDVIHVLKVIHSNFDESDYLITHYNSLSYFVSNVDDLLLVLPNYVDPILSHVITHFNFLSLHLKDHDLEHVFMYAIVGDFIPFVLIDVVSYNWNHAVYEFPPLYRLANRSPYIIYNRYFNHQNLR